MPRATRKSSDATERRFQLLLLLLGFLLGTLSTYSWEFYKGRSERHALHRLLRASIENEISAISDQVVLVRKDSANFNTQGRVRFISHVGYTAHDPSPYLPASNELGVLNAKTLRSLEWYLRYLAKARMARETLLGVLNQERIDRASAVSAYGRYLYDLDNVMRFGRGLLAELE